MAAGGSRFVIDGLLDLKIFWQTWASHQPGFLLIGLTIMEITRQKIVAGRVGQTK